VNTTLDENKSELGILVLSVFLQVLSYSNSFFDKMIQILWNLRSKSVGFQNSHNLVSCDVLYLCNSVRVSEDHTNLRWSETLLGKSADVLVYLLRRGCEPRWWTSFVWSSALRDTFSSTIRATHFVKLSEAEVGRMVEEKVLHRAQLHTNEVHHHGSQLLLRR